MQAPEPAPGPLAHAAGLPEGGEDQLVGAFFDSFDWEGAGLDAERLSAEDFLSSLGD